MRLLPDLNVCTADAAPTDATSNDNAFFAGFGGGKGGLGTPGGEGGAGGEGGGGGSGGTGGDRFAPEARQPRAT